MDCVWRTPPSLEDTLRCEVLHESRFLFRDKPAIFGINVEWWTQSDLDEMALVGTTSVNAKEQQLASDVFNRIPGSTFSTMSAASSAAEGEWRWTNDRQSLVREQERVVAQQAIKRAAQEERYKKRLRDLTWDKLLSETPFERWSPSPPFPPPDFTRAARDRIHSTCQSLRALGDKPKKAAVRKILRECVRWFNQADKQSNGVIETEEREDICSVLEEIAYVAGHRSLTDEVDEWRDW